MKLAAIRRRGTRPKAVLKAAIRLSGPEQRSCGRAVSLSSFQEMVRGARQVAGGGEPWVELIRGWCLDALVAHVLDRFFSQFLDPHLGIASILRGANRLVELCLECGTIPVLGILDENTIRNVTIVVPVLIISCHVSE
jgi:hypothetical protein